MRFGPTVGQWDRNDRREIIGANFIRSNYRLCSGPSDFFIIGQWDAGLKESTNSLLDISIWFNPKSLIFKHQYWNIQSCYMFYLPVLKAYLTHSIYSTADFNVTVEWQATCYHIYIPPSRYGPISVYVCIC